MSNAIEASTTSSMRIVHPPQRKSTFLPACVAELFNSANELALATSALCRATRVTCEIVEQAAVGMSEITSIMIAQQKKNLLAELQEA